MIDLDDHELALARRMFRQLDSLSGFHSKMLGYYEGSRRLQRMGPVIPKALRNLEVVAGWPGIAVDALEERLDWLGWAGGGEFGLDEVFRASRLGSESASAHLDALVHGTSFLVIAKDGGRVSVIPQSPLNTTGILSRDGFALDAALIRQSTEGRPDAWEVELFLPGRVLTVEVSGNLHANGGDSWKVLGEARTGLPDVVPVVPVQNQRRTSRPWGRSEISVPMRFYTDEAARALLGMSVNRDFYSFPQRYVKGVDQSDFSNPDGSAKPGWEIAAGAFLAMGKDDDGDLPDMGEFRPNSPAPFTEQIRVLAQLMAGAAAVPERYFGFVTSNPPSAEALLGETDRLVKRAERRQGQFGAAWALAGWLAARMLGHDVTEPEFHSRVRPRWRDAATPTRAATADAVTKLTTAGVLPPDSDEVLRMIDFDEATIASIQEHRRNAAPDPLAALAGAVGRQTDGTSEAAELKAKFDALSVAIRSGVDPDDAAAKLGLEGLEFTGAVPVSLRMPEADAEQLED